MAKLHELLAVKDSLRSQGETCRTDLKNTFEKKQAHFHERRTTFKSLKEGEPDKAEEQLVLQTTVHKELDWVKEKLAKAIDASHQVNVANTAAVGNVTLEDGTVLLTNVTATTLLELEKRIEEVQELVKSIPTLDPAKGYEPDKDRGDGIYQARVVEKPRTEKTFSYVVMYPATDKHPAQVKELMVDKETGHTVLQEWCSLLTVSQKGEMLDRTEMVMRAVKSARSRANDFELNVKDNKIGQTLLNYVFKGA